MPDVVRDLQPVSSRNQTYETSFPHLSLPGFHLASTGSHLAPGTQALRNMTSHPDIPGICLPQNIVHFSTPPASLNFTQHVSPPLGHLDTGGLTSLPPSASCHVITSPATGSNYTSALNEDMFTGPISYSLTQDMCGPCSVNVPATFPFTRNPNSPSVNLAVQEMPSSPPVLIIAKSNPKIQAAQAALQNQPQPISPTNNVYLLM